MKSPELAFICPDIDGVFRGALQAMKTYAILLFFHSLVRWLLLPALVYTLIRGIRGWTGRKVFTIHDNKWRHRTATLSHIQLVLGYGLYFNSPLVQWFRSHYQEAIRQLPILFFGLIHIIVMTLSILLITIGSAAAKRKGSDRDKFRTMTCWYATALLLIFLAIPWPFSPFAKRPIFRTF